MKPPAPAGTAARLPERRKPIVDPWAGFVTRKISPGECHVTDQSSDMIMTVLGSCVAACIRDPFAKVGGMNHFMLPESANGEWGPASGHLRYGNFAMESLINQILKRGGRRGSLEIKLFGGAEIAGSSVGSRNIDFVVSYMRSEGLRIAAQQLGGTQPVRIHYFPTTGRVMVREIRIGEALRSTMEMTRPRSADLADSSGEIELFG